MALVSLKREPDDYPTEYFENHFGYCTEISLDGEQCEKLGITKPMRVGQPVNIRAAGIVVSSSEYLEANTDSGHKDVDYGLVTRELGQMFHEAGIDLPKMPKGSFDDAPAVPALTLMQPARASKRKRSAAA